jgi:putative ABC transport system ATP-binding protein
MAGELLRLEDVSKEYSGPGGVARVLRGIDLVIRPRTLTVIAGPSGAGKSTLLHLMGALERPSSGRVLLDGQDLAKLPDDKLTVIRRRRLGFVFQFFNLLPQLPTWQNIALPLLLDGVAPDQAREIAAQLAERLGIADRLDVASQLLSGGQMQRVAVARALANNPALILADEPTGNLDQATGHKLLEVLRGLVREEGRTVVLVTHDASALAFGDWHVHLVDGCIVERKLRNGD